MFFTIILIEIKSIFATCELQVNWMRVPVDVTAVVAVAL